MLEKPDLSDDTLLAYVQRQYGILAASVEFLPLGNDASAWVYRLKTAEADAYFLKLSTGAIDPLSLRLPHWLKSNGIEQVIAPIPTLNGALSTPVESFTLAIYPFIDGSTGMEIGLTEHQWITFGKVLKQLHTAHPPDDLRLRRETFVPNPRWMRTVRSLQHIALQEHADPLIRELVAFCAKRRVEISQLADRAEQLGRLLQAQPFEFVPCHADIHTANVLIDSAGGLHIGDWDQPIYAPKERDLMFVVGADAANAQSESWFFAGYGAAALDSVVLAYYRYEWVIQDLGDNTERIVSTTNKAITRREALRALIAMFDPGDVVEAAYQCDTAIGSRFSPAGDYNRPHLNE